MKMNDILRTRTGGQLGNESGVQTSDADAQECHSRKPRSSHAPMMIDKNASRRVIAA